LALERQVGQREPHPGSDRGVHQDDPGGDDLAAERAGDRDAVVAVPHEVHLPDPVEVHRRQHLARREAAAIRSKRTRDCGLVGRNRRSKPLVRSTDPTIASRSTSCSPR